MVSREAGGVLQPKGGSSLQPVVPGPSYTGLGMDLDTYYALKNLEMRIDRALESPKVKWGLSIAAALLAVGGFTITVAGVFVDPTNVGYYAGGAVLEFLAVPTGFMAAEAWKKAEQQ